MKLHHLLIFLLLPKLAISQQAQQVYGLVTDTRKQVIAGAFISILRSDSTVITVTQTDTKGYYRINVPSGSSFIRVEMMGFTTQVQPVTGKVSINFSLSESANTHLKEISIAAKVPIVEYKADRTVFNVENSVAATGGDALDAIKHAPGVQATHSEITIAGKSSVSVMINGRLQQLSGDDLMQLLHSIPSENISKIEVITSPSSKYDAEGNSGIINLVLKKNRQKGVSGNITTAYEYNMGLSFPTISTSLNYKKDALNLYANANGGKQGYPYTAYTNSYYPTQFWHQDVSYPYLSYFGRLQLGGDYALTKRSTAGFTISEAFNKLDNKEHVVANGYDITGNPDSSIITQGRTTDSYPGKFSSNINYELRFDSTGKKLNIDADYYRQEGHKFRDFTISSYAGNSLVNEKNNRMTGNPLTEIKSIKADVELPFPLIRFTFGAKASESRNNLDNSFATRSGVDYVEDSARSSSFTYREQIQAAYLNLSGSWKKFEFSGGMRAEHTLGQGVSANNAGSFIVDYTRLFPSGFVQYKHHADHILSLTATRRISRPNYTFLNPFRFYYTPNTYVQGNTSLQPSTNFMTSFAYTYKSKWNLQVFYNTIANYFDRVYTIDTLEHSNAVSRRNIGNKEVFAANVSGSVEITPWWMFSGDINGGYVIFKPFDRSKKTEYSGFNWWIDASNVFYLNKRKTLSSEVSGYYYSGRQRDFVHWSPMWSLNLGIRYMLLNKNLILAVNGDDVFATSYWLQTNDLNNTREYSYDGHSYRISITYKFGNKNIRARQLRNVEEIQRAN